MTWKGTDHIHCCTQIINLEEEEKEKKRKKKEKQLSHRLGSHARTRVQQKPRSTWGSEDPPPPSSSPKKDQNKQERRRAAAGTAGLDADAWRGVDEAAAPRPGHRL